MCLLPSYTSYIWEVGRNEAKEDKKEQKRHLFISHIKKYLRYLFTDIADILCLSLLLFNQRRELSYAIDEQDHS